MIYDKIENIASYTTKHENLEKAYKSIASGAYLNFKDGKNDLDGDNLFAIKVNLILKKPEEGLFEAHRKYIDIHVPLCNSEDVAVSFLEDIILESEYDEEGDCLLGNSRRSMALMLSQGEFLVVFPQDAHKVGVSTAHSGQTYEKIIYKVRIWFHIINMIVIGYEALQS